MNLLLLAPLALALLAFAAIRAGRETRRWLVPGALLVLGLWIFAMPLTGNLLIGALEDDVRDIDCADARFAVLLAGGMRGRPDDASEHHRLSEASLRRTIEAANWLKNDRGSLRVYVVGGYGRQVREADVIVSLLQSLGVVNPLVAVVTPRNTEESAAAMVTELGEQSGPVALISSGFHLPRAMLEFERAGLNACPVATDLRRSRLGGLGSIAPSPYALSKSMLALHEFAGIVAFSLGQA